MYVLTISCVLANPKLTEQKECVESVVTKGKLKSV